MNESANYSLEDLAVMRDGVMFALQEYEHYTNGENHEEENIVPVLSSREDYQTALGLLAKLCKCMIEETRINELDERAAST